jgi:hypothetical protein
MRPREERPAANRPARTVAPAGWVLENIDRNTETESRTMSLKDAKQRFAEAAQLAQSQPDQAAITHLAKGLEELTRVLDIELSALKHQLRAVEQKVQQGR